ncbi:low molecular weight protein-tyrosine-phosphatase [Kineobactrum salinum]|uniref:protein-tyrosine-phosphatase n=1 Tax=Kineobactrum salinum TaxID=2708301 RepID=A0A6C0TY67_9GAMM|nr:low molecular weight protein-tyrosine-phosphatase [Kineobactrum salinum]QIB64741.1 low molecular weight phosphotyrosine protein phosphatase [Kineobactrum salinum]
MCTANVCRSPLAEGLLRARFQAMGLSRRIQVRSAGTRVAQRGRRPDQRAVKLAAEMGVNIRGIRARQADTAMILRSDVVLVMEEAHRRELEDLFPDGEAPVGIQLLASYLPDAEVASDIPDPYFGDWQGFTEVFLRIDAALEGFANTQARALIGLAS